MSSDQKINYSLRPSKSIERKMMLEVFKEICVPANCDDYQYIGFGASFFSDFKMIHRELGISKMLSIEGNSSQLNIKRCEYNIPFNCVKVRPGFSHQILPKIGWKRKSIVWLDYDKCLQNYMFDDIETCCQKAKSGGFLVLSLRKDFDQTEIHDFKEEFGVNVPSGIRLEDIEPANAQFIIREMFSNKINETLLNSYSSVNEENRLVFKQLFNLTYKDGTPMYTIGGMFILKKEEEDFNKFKFNSYDFVTDKKGSINISFPIITSKEYYKMTKLLPTSRDEFMNSEEIDFVPEIHKENYFNTYRYYPSYIEIKDF